MGISVSMLCFMYSKMCRRGAKILEHLEKDFKNEEILES